MKIGQCPQTYVGDEMISNIQIVNQCSGGVLPVSGGLLDQSAYYLALKTALDADESQINNDRNKG